jgi:putative transposase
VNLREEFVLQALEPGACMAKLCRKFGISRQNGYKWVERFRQEGSEGLRDRSRRPHGSPIQVSGELVLQVLELRHRDGWGPKKLARLLKQRLRKVRGARPPSERTIARILKRAALTKKRKRLVVPPGVVTGAPAPTVETPNDLWTVDFKGWWLAHNGERCEPLTLRDAFSRFVLAAALLESTRTATVKPVFERLFAKYGMPKAILSDNGSPFGCTSAPWGLSELSAWWVSLGIEVLHSRPGCPQDNGGHERVHVEMLQLQEESAPTRQAQQLLCDEWRNKFNHRRPHEALAMKTPAEVYRPKQKRRSPPTIRYHFPAGTPMRRVMANGHFWWRSRSFFLSRALRGHDVALVTEPGATRAKLMFRHLPLGYLDLLSGTKVEPLSDQICHPAPKASSQPLLTAPAAATISAPATAPPGLRALGAR